MACKVFFRIEDRQPKIPRPFACPGLRSDRGMQSTFGDLGNAAQNSKTLCMSWSEVRPWHATVRSDIHIQHLWISDFFWNLGHADITGQLISACHGLTSDCGMQIWFGLLGLSACTKKSEIHKCWMWMSERTVACHGLTSDQDMQRVLEFWAAFPKSPKVLCMPRSDLRPGHAKGLGIFGCLS